MTHDACQVLNSFAKVVGIPHQLKLVDTEPTVRPTGVAGSRSKATALEFMTKEEVLRSMVVSVVLNLVRHGRWSNM